MIGNSGQSISTSKMTNFFWKELSFQSRFEAPPPSSTERTVLLIAARAGRQHACQADTGSGDECSAPGRLLL